MVVGGMRVDSFDHQTRKDTHVETHSHRPFVLRCTSVSCWLWVTLLSQH